MKQEVVAEIPLLAQGVIARSSSTRLCLPSVSARNHRSAQRRSAPRQFSSQAKHNSKNDRKKHEDRPVPSEAVSHPSAPVTGSNRSFIRRCQSAISRTWDLYITRSPISTRMMRARATNSCVARLCGDPIIVFIVSPPLGQRYEPCRIANYPVQKVRGPGAQSAPTTLTARQCP